MGIRSGESSAGSSSSNGLAEWLPTLAVAGAAFAAGVLVVQLCSPARSVSKVRRTAVGIIPARYKSSRFEGKPLAMILGKTMIQGLVHLRDGNTFSPTSCAKSKEYPNLFRYSCQKNKSTKLKFSMGWDIKHLTEMPRTWEQAKLASSLEDVVVATDDNRIANCCRSFGANVVMTSETCANGTERCEEALRGLKKKYDIVVNIQGDEPLIDPDIINGVVQALRNSPDANFSTAVTDLSPEDALDPNRVKCVVDRNGYAIYFSRGMVPFNKKAIANPDFPYLLHLGIQCYDAKFLSIYPKLPSTPLQLEEDLEQLKVLENGHKMKIIKVDHTAHGVDVPSDIQKIESLMRAEHLT